MEENKEKSVINDSLLKEELNSVTRSSLVGAFLILLLIVSLIKYRTTREFIYWHLFVSNENIKSIDTYYKRFNFGKHLDDIEPSYEAVAKYFQEKICPTEISQIKYKSILEEECNSELLEPKIYVRSVSIDDNGKASVNVEVSAICKASYNIEEDKKVYKELRLYYIVEKNYNKHCFSCNKWIFEDSDQQIYVK